MSANAKVGEPDVSVEAANRRRHILFLGGVFLVGAVIPAPGPARAQLGPLQTGAFWADVLLLLYPFVAGIGVILLGVLAREQLRAQGLVLLALSMFMLLSWSPVEEALIDAILTDMKEGGVGGVALFLLSSCAAFCCLLVGSRARFYRPSSRAAGVIGLLGAGLFVAAHWMPVFKTTGAGKGVVSLTLDSLHGASGSAGLFILFLVLTPLACNFVAAALCFVNVIIWDPVQNRRVAKGAFRAVVTAMVLNVACFLVLAAKAAECEGFVAHLMYYLVVAKGVMLGCGGLLLLPVALTDLIVGRTVPVAKVEAQ